MEWEDYLEAHSSPEDDLLYGLNRWTHLNMPQPRMIAGAYQGRLLQMLTAMLQPRLVVEVGSYVGYSTICLARSLAKGGHLHAVEVDVECAELTEQHVEQAGLQESVTVHLGDAMQVIPSLPDEIDLAFIDADKRHLLDYYNLLLPKLRRGGWIWVDNVLWDGKVAQPEVNDRDTQLIRAFNDAVQHDPRVENILLPVRDGIMLCRLCN